MLMFNLAISCLSHSIYLDSWTLKFQVSMQYFSLQHHFTFTTRHIYNWASFLHCLSHFILSGAISNCHLLFLNNILYTFQPWGFIFQCDLFLPFLNAHGVLRAKILQWISISSSKGPCVFRTLHILVGPTWHSSEPHWVTQAPLRWKGWDLWRR